jgi:protein TonB
MALKKTPSAEVQGKTRRYFELSLVIALCIVISAFAFFPQQQIERSLITHSSDIVSVTDIPVTAQETLPPPPPRPPIPIESPDALDSAIPDFDTEVNPFDTTPPPPPPVADEEIEDDDLIFEAVEKYPSIIGGTEALAKALHYPDLAVRVGIEGTVVVKALIDRSGKVQRTEIVRSLGGGCDEAAMEAVRSLRFTPGLQRDKPVNVLISIPVHFRLH